MACGQQGSAFTQGRWARLLVPLGARPLARIGTADQFARWRAVSRPPRKRFKEVPKYKMLYESGAQSLAQSSNMELFLRLFWLAMWFAKPNGHANFRPGAIPELLDANDRSVRKARVKAIDTGLLLPMSSDICLSLPADLVGNKLIGHDKPCEICMGATARPKTSMTMRDREAEAFDRELYRRETKVQAAAVLAEPVVPGRGTSSSVTDIRTHEPDRDLMESSGPRHREIA
jgi:hypothetical protein